MAARDRRRDSVSARVHEIGVAALAQRRIEPPKEHALDIPLRLDAMVLVIATLTTTMDAGMVSRPDCAMLRAVIFDFDLTLADSTAGAIDCINHALRCLGLPSAPDRRILESIGLSLPDTFAYITGTTDPLMEEAFAHHFVARADEVMADLTGLYDCVPSVVRTLQTAGFTQGIVSSKFRYRIERIVAREQLVDCFPVIVGAEDTPYHKPHPAGLLQAVRRLGCQTGEVVYVGDHPVDAEAARGAGIAFVAVLTGPSEREQFLEGQPLGIIDNLAGLPPLLGVGR